MGRVKLACRGKAESGSSARYTQRLLDWNRSSVWKCLNSELKAAYSNWRVCRSAQLKWKLLSLAPRSSQHGTTPFWCLSTICAFLKSKYLYCQLANSLQLARSGSFKEWWSFFHTRHHACLLSDVLNPADFFICCWPTRYGSPITTRSWTTFNGMHQNTEQVLPALFQHLRPALWLSLLFFLLGIEKGAHRITLSTLRCETSLAASRLSRHFLIRNELKCPVTLSCWAVLHVCSVGHRGGRQQRYLRDQSFPVKGVCLSEAMSLMSLSLRELTVLPGHHHLQSLPCPVVLMKGWGGTCS